MLPCHSSPMPNPLPRDIQNLPILTYASPYRTRSLTFWSVSTASMSLWCGVTNKGPSCRMAIWRFAAVQALWLQCQFQAINLSALGLTNRTLRDPPLLRVLDTPDHFEVQNMLVVDKGWCRLPCLSASSCSHGGCGRLLWLDIGNIFSSVCFQLSEAQS